MGILRGATSDMWRQWSWCNIMAGLNNGNDGLTPIILLVIVLKTNNSSEIVTVT